MTTNAATPLNAMHTQIIEAKPLAKLLRAALVCACDDLGRPSIARVRFEPSPHGVKLVSTDGHRLSVITTRELTWAHALNLPQTFLKAVLELCKDGGYITVGHDAETVSFADNGGTYLRSRPPELVYPSYAQLPPSRSPVQTMVGTAGELAKRVRATEAVGKAGGLICLQQENDNEDSLAPRTLDKSGADAIGVWKQYLLDALRLFPASAEVRVGRTGGTRDPLTIDEPGAECSAYVLLMPMLL